MSQQLGAGRVIGQVYAHVYFSKDPQTLDDFVKALSISKGSASMCVRQLEHWGALHRVWVKGDRKDHYEAATRFGVIIRKVLFEVVGRTLENSQHLIDDANTILHDTHARKNDDEDLRFVRERVNLIRHFRDRSKKNWDSVIVKLLMK